MEGKENNTNRILNWYDQKIQNIVENGTSNVVPPQLQDLIYQKVEDPRIAYFIIYILELRSQYPYCLEESVERRMWRHIAKKCKDKGLSFEHLKVAIQFAKRAAFSWSNEFKDKEKFN